MLDFIFKHCKFLTVGRVKSVNVRHGAKFRDDHTAAYRYGDISIFKMAAAAILDF